MQPNHSESFWVRSQLSLAGPERNAYGSPKHSTSDLRYLCACYADLDFDRLTGLTYKEVIGRISEYQADGKMKNFVSITDVFELTRMRVSLLT
jgi:hypothetical protein